MTNRQIGIFLLAFVGASFFTPSAARAYDLVKNQSEQTVFAPSIEDLPVMPGLQVVEDKDTLFVFGSQRIAQTLLRGGVDIDDVYYFYGKVLPELGWKRITSKIYERGSERLVMKPSSANEQGVTYVRFEVEPVG